MVLLIPLLTWFEKNKIKLQHIYKLLVAPNLILNNKTEISYEISQLTYSKTFQNTDTCFHYLNDSIIRICYFIKV